MRMVMFLVATLSVLGAAFWAYQENYRTQAAMAEVRKLHGKIGAAHERLAMLRAEWAYLNRPDRLADLADLNFDRLGLFSLTPDAFARVDQIIYPLPVLSPVTNPVALSSNNASTEEPL